MTGQQRDASGLAPIRIRVASYNVLCGQMGTPEQIGEMFRPYDLDVIGFCEAPAGDWTARVGEVLGMGHAYVGNVSSANHKDKYKSILSRTPLANQREHVLAGRGWNPASAVSAETVIGPLRIAFYSLHICANHPDADGKIPGRGQAQDLAERVLPAEKAPLIIAVGDYNEHVDSDSLRRLEAAGMRATWLDLNTDLSRAATWPSAPREHDIDPLAVGVIDHILYSVAGGARAVDGGIIELDPPLSDHKPIWADLRVQPQQD